MKKTKIYLVIPLLFTIFPAIAVAQNDELATIRQRIAALEDRMVRVEKAIGVLGQGAEAENTNASARSESLSIIQVKLKNKHLKKLEFSIMVVWDISYEATGLLKPTRAIKGTLEFSDLFGEPKARLQVTLEKPMKPGERYRENGVGFKLNRFIPSQMWLAARELSDMRVNFRVQSILYADGSRKDFDQ